MTLGGMATNPGTHNAVQARSIHNSLPLHLPSLSPPFSSLSPSLSLSCCHISYLLYIQCLCHFLQTIGSCHLWQRIEINGRVVEKNNLRKERVLCNIVAVASLEQTRHDWITQHPSFFSLTLFLASTLLNFHKCQRFLNSSAISELSLSLSYIVGPELSNTLCMHSMY